MENLHGNGVCILETSRRGVEVEGGVLLVRE